MTEVGYFERMYAEAGDPWQLAEREYERRKYALTIASLPRRRYARAFEPGCSIGVLTALLAERCEELIATDPVEAPLQRARRDVPADHVSFGIGSVPADWPEGDLDLVILSELLYYLSSSDRAAVLERTVASLTTGGHLVLVHWRHPFEAAACTGDDVHDEVAAHPALVSVVEHVETDFRLEVLTHAQEP